MSTFREGVLHVATSLCHYVSSVDKGMLEHDELTVPQFEHC